MSHKQRTIPNKPLLSHRINRVLAARALIEAIKTRKLAEYELLESEEKVGQALGARRHALMLRDVDDGRMDSGDRDIHDGLSRLRTEAIRYLRAFADASADAMKGQPDRLSMNVQRFARLLALNANETRLLDFLVRVQADPELRDAVSEVDAGSEVKFTAALARILAGRRNGVRDALSAESRLVASGILELNEGCIRSVGRPGFAGLDDIRLLPGLCQGLVASNFSFERVFSPFFRRCGSGKLSLDRFAYLGDTVEVARALLSGAVASGRPGVQILLFGPPGTGKTELAHALAQAIGKPLYAIAAGSPTGLAYDRDDRYRCFRLAQQALRSRRGSLVLFDEVEDVFCDSSPYTRAPQLRKGWTNEMLETNAVPSIWISNQTAFIDDAYLRRFTLIIHVERPPRSVRRDICETYLRDVPMEEGLIARLADADSITPADLERARTALDMATELRKEPTTASRAVTALLGSGPRAPGQSALLPKREFKLPDFDPALINTDLDLERLLEGLARSGEGRLCLYGAPGTGKTAFVRHVAERLDRELMVVSASDWLDPFVGMTERKIRASFERAARLNAVLFVDEADSFLRDRSLARQSWEATQVNELLKRLEKSRGVVAFATNDFDVLDPAVLRRLDIKAAFRPLNREQTRTMFERTLEVSGMTPSKLAHKALDQVASLNGIVNGDFAAACRRLHVSGQSVSAMNLAEALQAEVNVRARHRHTSIGFAAPLE